MSKAKRLRALYIVAAIDAAIMGALSPWIIGALFGSLGESPNLLTIMAPALFAASLGFVALLAAYIFLAVKPYGWGKLALAFPGFSWVGFSVASSIISLALSSARSEPSAVSFLFVPGACGAVLLALAVLHQLTDPRWSGAPLRDSRTAS